MAIAWLLGGYWVAIGILRLNAVREEPSSTFKVEFSNIKVGASKFKAQSSNLKVQSSTRSAPSAKLKA